MAEELTETAIEALAKIMNHFVKHTPPGGRENKAFTDSLEANFSEVDCFKILQKGLILDGAPEGMAKRIVIYGQLGKMDAVKDCMNEIKEQVAEQGRSD